LKSPWFSRSNFSARLNKLILKKYMSYSLMTLVTAATVPISQLFIRSYTINHLSVIEAGWWEGMNRISGMYLMVITTSFSVYYLPRLSEINDKNELKKEIYTAFKVIIPMLLICFTGIFLLRDLIIKVLFSSDFYPMRNLFIWQLLGDIFKITTWLIGFTCIAKSLTKVFVFNEIFFSLLFVFLSIILIKYFGVIGITIAYLLNYILGAIFMVYVFKKVLMK
jgi:O-antigen/teichoic acid export membrane protein